MGEVRQIAACVITRKNHREYVAALRGNSGNIVITNTQKAATLAGVATVSISA